jgi:magnesium transporter
MQSSPREVLAGGGENAVFDADKVASALSRALREGDTVAIEQWIDEELAADVAEALTGLAPEQAAQTLSLAAREQRARVFVYLPRDAQLGIVAVMDFDTVAALVEAMPHDERADFFKALPGDERRRLLPALARAEREDVRQLASYEEETGGALMTSDYVTLRRDMTVVQALAHLRRVAPDSETIYSAYVVDEDRHLLGVVTLRQLITAPDDARVDDLMQEKVVHALVNDDQEAVARTIARYDFIALPVLDEDERLVGIVTADDAMDVVEAEATEDILLSATVNPIEDSVARARLSMLYRKRIGWLVLLVFASLATGMVLDFFRGTISANMGLLFFLPLLIATSGNAGAQAATLMVRALATGEVVAGDWLRLLGREAVVSTALGVTLALAMLAIGLIHSGPSIAILVALTMITVVLVGSLIGLCLPFALSHLKLDPATASVPLVTSLSDVGGVLIYFGFAALLLPRLG